MEKEYEPFEIDIDALGYYVNRAFFAMMKLLNKKLRESGLNIQHAEFTILRVLDNLKGASQSQLAAVLGKERSGLGRSLVSLEEKGYITRRALNGSTNFITLTDKAETAMAEIKEITRNVTEQAFKGFSQRSRDIMIKNLTKIYHNSL